jgi:hypothetical protein
MFSKEILDIDYNKLVDYVTSLCEERMEDPLILSHQIATQCRKDNTDFEFQLKESTLSLLYDWNTWDQTSGEPPSKIPEDQRLTQEQFTETCDLFKGTVIEEVNEIIKEQYGGVRGRILSLPPKFSMTYHYDESPRIHIPIKVNEKTFMVLEKTCYWFEVGNSYYVDTRKWHTAVNASVDSRIHLVYCLPRE